MLALAERVSEIGLSEQERSKEQLAAEWARFVADLNLEEEGKNRWLATTPHGRRLVQGVFLNTEPGIYYQHQDRTFATRVPGLDPRKIQTPPGFYHCTSWKYQP